MTVADLPALAEAGAAAGVPLVVDNTVATPYLCRPIEHGAAVVVHSATKYLGGHSDVVGGIAVFAERERHDAAWRAMIELGASPTRSPPGWSCAGSRPWPSACGPTAPTPACWPSSWTPTPRWPASTGPACPATRRPRWPPSCWTATRGCSASTWPGREAGRRFIEATRVAKLAPSLGTVETLVSHPASTTHRQFAPDALAAAGIGEGMVRVSVGLEDAADLAEDFTHALEVA